MLSGYETVLVEEILGGWLSELERMVWEADEVYHRIWEGGGMADWERADGNEDVDKSLTMVDERIRNSSNSLLQLSEALLFSSDSRPT